MRRITNSLILAALAILCPASAFAVPVTVGFEVAVSSKFDWVTKTYSAITPVVLSGSFTFDNVAAQTSDSGPTTDVRFGTVTGTTWNAPFASTFPVNSGAFGPFSSSYVFGAVYDYPSVFFEEPGAIGYSSSQAGSIERSYEIELRVRKTSSPKNGDGTSDYAFTSTSIVDYFQSFVLSGAPVTFDESYSVYDTSTHAYLEGTVYSDLNAKITSVTINSIPEPSSITILSLGILGLAGLRRIAGSRGLKRQNNEAFTLPA